MLWQVKRTYSKARVYLDPPPLPAPLPHQPDLHHHLPQHLRWPQLQPDRGEIKAWYNLIHPLTKQVISSPAFINNEYLICQNLLYVNGNSSLPVYQEAEQVTDVRCQFVKVLLFIPIVLILLVLEGLGIGLDCQHSPCAHPTNCHSKVCCCPRKSSEITFPFLSLFLCRFPVVSLWQAIFHNMVK